MPCTRQRQGSSAVGFNYDNANRRTCLTLPNNVLVSYGYDTDSRVTSIGYGTGGSCSRPPTNLGTLTYSYDAGGRRTATGGSLAAVTLPSAVNASSTLYNADNEQTKFGSASSLTYDADGELNSDGTNTYTWDARNHLTQIAQGRTVTASFVYDAFGRRMNKTIGSTVTQFVYDRRNPVQELNSSNGVVANLLTGLGIDEYFTRTASSTTSTLLADALGSTIGLVTASNGPIATSYTYQPFGGTTTSGTGNTNPYQFTGRENDGTGLYFYRARYYSPTFQRFVSQDPIGFRGGDPNLYAFVGDEPLNKKDPKGTGVTAVVAVAVGCSIYNLYETASLFSQSTLLQEQIIKIQEQIDELKKSKCPANVDPTEYNLRLEKVTNDLQGEIFRLTQQFATANGSNVAQGLTTEGECLAASAAAVFVPEP